MINLRRRRRVRWVSLVGDLILLAGLMILASLTTSPADWGRSITYVWAGATGVIVSSILDNIFRRR